MGKVRIDVRSKDTKIKTIIAFDREQIINKWSKAGRIELQYKVQ